MGNWLYNSLLKQWCEDNRVIYKEEKDMTYGTRVMIKRICDELMKWCEERHVMCEFATTDDEGLSATFIVGGTTLSVSHIELRDPEEFSRYVKNVLFGIDESKDIPVGTESLCSRIEWLEQELEEKEKNLNRAADRIIQLKCVNTSLKEQVDILKCSLNNSCENYDLQVTKRMKAEGEIENLKKQLNDIIVTKTKTIDEDITIIENLKRENVSLKKENATLQYRVDALQNDRKDLLSGYKKDLDNLNNEIKRLKQQIM